MIKLNILLGFIMLVLALFAAAPPANEEMTRVEPSIEQLYLRETGEPNAPWLLELFGSQRHSCNADWQTRVYYFPDNVDLELFQEIPADGRCAQTQKDFELTLALELEIAIPYIIVNDGVWRADAAARRATPTDYKEQILKPVVVEKAALSTAADGRLQNALRIQGWQGTGCDAREIFTLRIGDAGMRVGVYNALAADTVCPQVQMPVDQIVTLPATEAPAHTLLSVNTYQVEAQQEQMVSESDKVLTNIFRVDVNVTDSEPLRISLAVEGEHPDGCEYPVIVGQERVGDRVEIEVYRRVPADVVCPMILKPYRDSISLNGDFEPGNYTISVNGHSQTVSI